MNRPDPGGVHGLTTENFLGAFPMALDKDSKALTQAEITAEELQKRLGEIDLVRLYAMIDRLPEPLLDVLAYDFKIDWWDPEYSPSEKRRILKDSWYVHKHLGTKSAVETALRAIYSKAEVLEWFEYGGEPYYFRLNIDLTGEISDAARPWRVMERVNFYKSLRSHLEKIVFTTVLPPYSIHIGGDFGAQPSIGVPMEPDVYDFRDAIHAGGHFSDRTIFPVPEDTAPPPTTTILRSGGVFTFISNLSGEE